MDPTDPPIAGHALAAERERQGLSRVEMAQRLHMSPSQVEALETGDYDRLPKGPFVRGFVRNYAKALGLDADAVVARLDAESPPPTAPHIVVPSQNIRFDPMGDRFSSPYVKAAGLAAVAIALGFAAMYWWLFIRTTPPAAHRPEPASPVASAPPPANGTASAPAPETQAVKPEFPPAQPEPPAARPEPLKRQPEPRKAEAAKVSETASAAAPAAGESVLRFHFKGESWVEVRDSKGKVLMQRTNPAGSDATVAGRAPLRVIVGNAPEVTLRYNDRDFPLEPHSSVGVARFTLE